VALCPGCFDVEVEKAGVPYSFRGPGRDEPDLSVNAAKVACGWYAGRRDKPHIARIAA
jgi:hypothetical protein